MSSKSPALCQIVLLSLVLLGNCRKNLQYGVGGECYSMSQSCTTNQIWGIGTDMSWLKSESKKIHIFTLQRQFRAAVFHISLFRTHREVTRIRHMRQFLPVLCAFGRNLSSKNKKKRHSGGMLMMWRYHKASCSFGRAQKRASGCGPAGNPGKKTFFWRWCNKWLQLCFQRRIREQEREETAGQKERAFCLLVTPKS